MRPVMVRASSGARRLAYRLVPLNFGERGISLIAVMVIMTSVVLVGVAIMTLGTAETDIVQDSVEGTQAFYAAEAGIERTQKVLDQLAKYGTPDTPPGSQGEGIYPADLEFANVRVGDGLYNVTVTKTSTSDPWDTTYEVVSTGEVHGVTRELRATMCVDAFSKFLFFVNDTKRIVAGELAEVEDDTDPDLWYTDEGDTLELYNSDVFYGRVHLNDMLVVKGDPFFGGKVTTYPEETDIEHGSLPVFAKGLETGVDYLPLPDHGELRLELAEIASQGGICFPTIPGDITDLNGNPISHRTYDVVLGRGGILGTLSYRVGDRQKLNQGDESSVTEWTDVNLSTAGNGVVWFLDKIRIAGTLRGQVTIGSKRPIYIVGDILYENSTPGEGPDPDCTDLLGLIGKKVKIAKTAANEGGVEVHAAIMSMQRGIEAERIKDFGDRGDLIVHGAVIVAKIDKLNEHKEGEFRGFHRRYHFDRRLAAMAPPFFPRTRDVSIYRWRENPVIEDQ